MNGATFHQNLLQDELARRCEKNPLYSMRAFASALNVDCSALSRIIAGKQVPSYKIAQKIFTALGLGPEEQELFLRSAAESQRNRGLQRVSPVFRQMATEKRTPKPVKDLSIDLYRVIADWHHVAILELTLNDDFDSDPRSIAAALGIAPAEAMLAVQRLLKLELLKRDANGRLVKTNARLSTADKHITTPALRRNQKQFLDKAIDSLENDSIEERSHTSMTMAIDPEKLPVAKEMIRDFNKALCDFLESGKRTQVYNMSIALYPIQKKKKPVRKNGKDPRE